MQCESTEDDLSNIMEWYPFNNNTLLQCESTEDDLSSIMEWYPFNNNTLLQCESTEDDLSSIMEWYPTLIIHYYSVNPQKMIYLI